MVADIVRTPSPEKFHPTVSLSETAVTEKAKGAYRKSPTATASMTPSRLDSIFTIIYIMRTNRMARSQADRSHLCVDRLRRLMLHHVGRIGRIRTALPSSVAQGPVCRKWALATAHQPGTTAGFVKHRHDRRHAGKVPQSRNVLLCLLDRYQSSTATPTS